jgi:hypothetical protein
MLYLAYLGFAGLSGILLWPAVVLHAILTTLLSRELRGYDVTTNICVWQENRRPVAAS